MSTRWFGVSRVRMCSFLLSLLFPHRCASYVWILRPSFHVPAREAPREKREMIKSYHTHTHTHTLLGPQLAAQRSNDNRTRFNAMACKTGNRTFHLGRRERPARHRMRDDSQLLGDGVTAMATVAAAAVLSEKRFNKWIAATGARAAHKTPPNKEFH